MSYLRTLLTPAEIRWLVQIHCPPRRCALCKRLARPGLDLCFHHQPNHAIGTKPP